MRWCWPRWEVTLNYRGSSRRLLGNARSAMVGAIEIYNKPRFAYRDEVFVLLIVNAWELLLKAIISKAGYSIFYRKKRKQPYRTLSWSDALSQASATDEWPKDVPARAVELNLEMLAVYRDNAVHFYNSSGFGTVIYSLAQTSIVNFRDVLRDVFKQELGDEMNWALLPLSVRPPIDPIHYLRSRPASSPGRTAIDQFLKSLRDATIELESSGIDTSRLFTVFGVSLQSIKKIEQADIVVGVGAAAATDPVIVTRRVDPNISHPHRRKDVLAKLAKDGASLSPYEFDACVRYFELRDDPRYCWRDKDTDLTKWSPETIVYLQRLAPGQVEEARAAYRERQRAASVARRRRVKPQPRPSA
jgi:Domain of unknown function (DUF3644)